METVQDRVGMLRNCDTFEQNSIVKFDKNVGYNVAILAGTSYQFINMETTLRLGNGHAPRYLGLAHWFRNLC